MPGCTAPNCTNSSQKGFKLFHFPSDRERCAVWIKNCGRELGWLPTRHTCLCEVHFEESQFELHRADGLRKLKPFAVPTLFDLTVPAKKKRKGVSDTEIEKQRILLKHFMKLKKIAEDAIANKDDSPPPSKVKKTPTNTNKPGRKYTRSPGSKKKKISKDVLKKYTPPVEEIVELDPSDETNGCFICGCSMNKRIPLKNHSETSKVCLNQKLVQLVAQDFDLLVEDGDAICTICAKILNCIDYVETVRSTLSKGILNRMKKKFGMQPTEETDILVYMKSLRNLQDFYAHKDMDGVQLSQKKNIETVTSNAMHSNQYQETTDIEIINEPGRTGDIGETDQSRKKWNLEESGQLSKSMNMKISNPFCKTLNMVVLNQSQESEDIEESNHSNNTVDLEESSQCTETLDPDESLSIILDLEKSNQSSSTLNLEDSNQSVKILESEDEAIESDKTFVQEESNESNKFLDEEDNNHSCETVDLVSNNQSNDADNVKDSEEKALEESPNVEVYECEICSYKADYKALMVFHIRQHFQDLYSCDFCTTPVLLDDDQTERLPPMNTNVEIEEAMRKYISLESKRETIDTQSALSENNQSVSQLESSESLMKENTTEKINEDVSESNNASEICNEGELMSLTNENIPKDKSVLVTFLPPVDMGEVTSLQNMAGDEIENENKSSPTQKEEESGNDELYFTSANDLPSDTNNSESDLATYSFLDNYDPSEIGKDISTTENCENIDDNL